MDDDKSSKKGEDEVILEIPTWLVLDEILSRLTVKELCRFKCVSKLWSKSFSDPYFLSLHSLRSHQNPPFFFFMAVPFDRHPYHQGRGIQDYDATLHISTADHEGQPITQFTKPIKVKEYPYIFLLPSHKQLICLCGTDRIYVCNPSTQDFIELPKGLPLHFCLYHVGFGYLPSSMEYKVVRLFHTHSNEDSDDDHPVNHPLGCEVLTISNSSNNSSNSYVWRAIEEECPSEVDEFGSVTVNGFVIWQVVNELISSEEDDDGYIVCFNLETEKFGFVPPPPYCLNMEHGFRLAELKGNLWYVDYGEGPLIMNLWILKDWNTFLWVKQYNISFTGPEGWYGRKPLDIIQQEDDEEVILFHGGRVMQYYHVQSKTLIPLGYAHGYNFCFYQDGFFSLASPAN